ncbi:hypothetical protein KGF56_002247 [Candida oxycetoniae]|uniref:Pore and endoplasmic reticulum protein of 33 kDa n=1 Tax=Candida oxycetoniae TaxID=497107 RepID=A0AAI9SXJ2_9ASCO|nr:uncharacterized protein KGF56_002247 [Candida oxycetoniae]KAI3404918.2 hypothetical protein KGF56_002247 [Candida oxycetoniae]
MAPKTSSSSTLKHQTPAQQLIKVVQTQQFYWFLGHVFAILFSVLSGLTGLFYRQKASLRQYRFALLSIIITYIIVIKQVYFKNGLKQVTVARLLRDENVQYTLFASILYFASLVTESQVPTSLWSYDIFAVFHVLTYFQNHLLSAFIPSLQTQQRLNSKINEFTNKFNQPALYTASSIEIVMVLTTGAELILLPIALILRWRSFTFCATKVFVFLSVVIFNKLRFDASQYTKSAVSQLENTFAGYIARINNPKLTQLYASLKAHILNSLKLIQLPKETKKTQ